MSEIKFPSQQVHSTSHSAHQTTAIDTRRCSEANDPKLSQIFTASGKKNKTWTGNNTTGSKDRPRSFARLHHGRIMHSRHVAMPKGCQLLVFQFLVFRYRCTLARVCTPSCSNETTRRIQLTLQIRAFNDIDLQSSWIPLDCEHLSKA